MTISAMEKKRVVFGIAICFVFSSIHEVSCQVGGNDDSNLFEDPELPALSIQSVITPIEEYIESENKNDREGESSTISSKKTSSSMFRSMESVTTLGGSSDFNNLIIQSEAVSGHEGGRRGSHSISIIRATKDMGGDKIGLDWTDRMIERDMEDVRRKLENEIERVMKAAEKTKRKSKLKTCESNSEADEREEDETESYKAYLGNRGEKETEKKSTVDKAHKVESKVASTGNYQRHESKKTSGAQGSWEL